jgi:hypothetical protein
VEFESIEVNGTNAVIKMSSIGTALGARLRLRKAKWYEGCQYSFGEEETEGALDDLRERWEMEKLEQIAMTASEGKKMGMTGNREMDDNAAGGVMLGGKASGGVMINNNKDFGGEMQAENFLG